MTDKDIRTWHYGLVARWWAEFNEGGVDVGFFQNVIERCGEPALDAGCGTGRLLIPCLRSGHDVDGTDVSSDMLDWCALAAAAEGLKANLYEQAMHELDLPRRYRTVCLFGSFGLGGTRTTDLEGLRRIHSHLEPGGTLLMDHHLPRSDSDHRQAFAGDLQLPAPWPDLGIRRRTSTGTELELKTRLFAVDPLERAITREISIREFADGTDVAHETGSIVICGYSTAEVRSVLEVAGFQHVGVVEGLEGSFDPKERRVLLEARA
jgi:SAM-dependent methyltransferase